jgi:hypothetical protein
MCGARGHVRFTPNSDRKSGHHTGIEPTDDGQTKSTGEKGALNFEKAAV